ncbi:hypothetical protein TURU_102932 [Turdus rufiventris]|nr:hypothetical protein TURU_102932 [Turdus rufiventris]
MEEELPSLEAKDDSSWTALDNQGYSSDPIIICSQTVRDEKNNDTFQKIPKNQMEPKPPNHIMKTTKRT